MTTSAPVNQEDLTFFVHYEWIDELGNGLPAGQAPQPPHSGSLIIKLNDVPQDRLVGGSPKTGVVWQAEHALINQVRAELPPAAIVVAWRMLLNDKSGILISEYRLHYFG
ncbi:MAG TPA: hypothetical protein VFE23_10755 [Usitatibacter sp.]|jgi:hypothetical protein|nr:hypothetical protein [Usitatibacter sp.]